MQIAQKLSGFTAGQADILRRAMGKKKRAELERQKERGIVGRLLFVAHFLGPRGPLRVPSFVCSCFRDKNLNQR